MTREERRIRSAEIASRKAEISKTILERKEEIIDKYYWDEDYSFIGIRVQETPFELGTINHKSLVWEDGNETDEELEGICVVDIKYFKSCSSYYGQYVAIICGNNAEIGEDAGELIIQDAVVVEIL